MDEEEGTDTVDAGDAGDAAGRGVDKLKAEVGVCAGSMVAAGFPESGVDAASVASRFEVGVDADVPRLQARIDNRSPIQIKSRLFIFFLNGFKIEFLPADDLRPHTSTLRT